MSSASDQRSARILKNLLTSISEGNYYEGHQALRTVVNRYIKSSKFDAAIDFLHAGAKELSKHDQWGSVSDLILYILKIYKEQNLPVSVENKERLCDLLVDYPVDDKEIKTIISSATAWSISSSNSSSGDSVLHHFFGTFLSQGNEFIDSEKHFLFGTPESAVSYGKMLYAWSVATGGNHHGIFLSRGVLQYLSLGNIDMSSNCLSSFMKCLKLNNSSFEAVEAESQYGNITVEYTKDHPLVGFCQLVLMAVQKSNGDINSPASRTFSVCRKRYSVYFAENEKHFSSILDKIGALYFGILVQKQANMFEDLMNSFFAPNNAGAIGN
ncbi:hypothetical protein BB561_001800 [Smittium simulii]|uniref:Golgi to ER traffic protein 4 n=1 Tax=Smittium simulii TaxID=133385 RepID=A0A2T9YT30_9FUNG|nr:hypothetical protein BB561_001800 [Smittium simulii]